MSLMAPRCTTYEIHWKVAIKHEKARSTTNMAERASWGRWERPGACLALGVLLSLACLLETSLLTLDDAGVTTQEAGLLQGGAVVLGVDLVQ
jgi:hypothetical protein